MANKTPDNSRAEPRGEQTRLRLIECAESLFAEEGIDAVSLRQIGVAIGSSNTNIIGYHFGTKTDLIQAILEYRLPLLEARREELYRQCTKKNRRDMEHLLYVFWWPLYEQKDNEGRHSYAGFLSQLIRAGRGELRGSVRDNYPVTEKIVGDMHALMPEMADRLFQERMYIASVIVSTTLHTIDHGTTQRAPSTLRKTLFFDALRMAAAALLAAGGNKLS